MPPLSSRLSILLAAALLFAAALPLPAAVSPANAQTARQISWDDLMPPDAPIDDPFATLAMEIVVKLEDIIGIRMQKEKGLISPVSPAYEQAVEMEDELKRQGVDVERLIRLYRKVDAEIARRDRLVVPALNGQFVKIPGYALPLETTGAAIEEFLLVPYVGACIHVPPPPPNQMIFVKLKEPFLVTDVFAPVWITGRLTAQSSTNSLYISDGRAPVESGYSIENAAVEPYRE